MDGQIKLPTIAEIDEQIIDCRQELAALKKLRNLAKTAQQADVARTRRQNRTKILDAPLQEKVGQ